MFCMVKFCSHLHFLDTGMKFCRQLEINVIYVCDQSFVMGAVGSVPQKFICYNGLNLAGVIIIIIIKSIF
jgi:hypothetical protein